MSAPRTPAAEKSLWIAKAMLAIELAQAHDARQAILGALYDAAEANGACRGAESIAAKMVAALDPPHSWQTEEHEPELVPLPSEVNDDIYGISADAF